MTTINLSKAKALLNSAFLGDLRAIANLLRGLVTGSLVTPRYVKVPDAATCTVLAEDSGKTHILPDLTADITISLPPEQDGLEYRFIYAGAAADAQDWLIDTGSNTNFFKGGVLHVDADAGAAADECIPISSDGNSNSKMTVLTPDVGTWVHLFCDGTVWYVNGMVVSATAAAAAFADQS